MLCQPACLAIGFDTMVISKYLNKRLLKLAEIKEIFVPA